jgi:hypothetical protein
LSVSKLSKKNMVDEIIEEVLVFRTLEDILRELEINDEEVLQCLLDGGLILRSDLGGILSFDEDLF